MFVVALMMWKLKNKKKLKITSNRKILSATRSRRSRRKDITSPSGH